jgi:hypothetical protein
MNSDSTLSISTGRTIHRPLISPGANPNRRLLLDKILESAGE